MVKIKLTKTAVEAARPQGKDIELRDTVMPYFLCKTTPTGRRVFMSSTARTWASPASPRWACTGN